MPLGRELLQACREYLHLDRISDLRGPHLRAGCHTKPPLPPTAETIACNNAVRVCLAVMKDMLLGLDWCYIVYWPDLPNETAAYFRPH
eukprot:scaffold218778_cov31-Prasinocladus_malaysianus.AAC.1